MGNQNNSVKYQDHQNNAKIGKEFSAAEDHSLDHEDDQYLNPLSLALEKGILKHTIIEASNNKLLSAHLMMKMTLHDQKQTKSAKCRISLDQKLNTLIKFKHGHYNRQNDIEYLQTKINSNSSSDQNKSQIIDQQGTQANEIMFQPIKLNQENLITIKKVNIESRYKFEEKIGQGGFGIVYKAKCLKTGEFRAVKILKINTMTTEQRQVILNEVRILLKMDHPSIIKVYEVVQSDDNYYIVTEFCQGGTITSYIQKFNQKYLEETIKNIMRKLLTAVSYIHSQGYIHRDLKLDNIVYQKIRNQQQQNLIIKIIDFGLAKSCNSPSIQQNKVIGTIPYLSPQNLNGVYSTKSDAWSCGVIMYALFRGVFPFQGDSKLDIFWKIQHKKLNLHSFQWFNISVEARSLMEGMLKKQDQKRITITEALAHPWFKDKPNIISCNKYQLTDSLAPKLKNYFRQNNLISFIERYVSLTQVNQKDRENLIRHFNKIDRNQNGHIQIEELREYFRSENCPVEEDELKKIFESIDTTKKGCIDLNQFICALLDRQKYFQYATLQELFQQFDVNKDGFIEKNEVKLILRECELKEIDYLTGLIDRNLDDKISKKQFIDYVLGKILKNENHSSISEQTLGRNIKRKKTYSTNLIIS